MTTTNNPGDLPIAAAAVTDTAAAKPKRRTKAQIEADNAAGITKPRAKRKPVAEAAAADVGAAAPSAPANGPFAASALPAPAVAAVIAAHGDDHPVVQRKARPAKVIPARAAAAAAAADAAPGRSTLDHADTNDDHNK